MWSNSITKELSSVPYCVKLHRFCFCRTVREVYSADKDKVIPDSKVLESLITALRELQNIEEKDRKSGTVVMYNALGYEIKTLDSTIPGAGKGVFVTRGKIPAGSLVALYPGTANYM